jgi:hypothetical protein
MRRNAVPLSIAAAISAVVVAIAFGSAPRSCDGGLTFYFWSGVVALMLLASLPVLGAIGNSVPSRIAWGAGFVVLGAAAWLAGLFAANVRIVCGLI